MQTFLPYADFHGSVICLDNKRLGKQRVEAVQILNTLTGKSKGWANHPAVKMWTGKEPALITYLDYLCTEWKRRGFDGPKCAAALSKYRADFTGHIIVPPDWFGDNAFHDSHKSNLLRKNPQWYQRFNWQVPDDLPYVWP